MMVTIQLKGRITESGELEIKLPEGLKPGNVIVTIEWTEKQIADYLKSEPIKGAKFLELLKNKDSWKE